MRFLILSQYFLPEPGAAQVRLAALSGELVGLGHEVEVVTAMPNYPNGRIFEQYRRVFYRRELMGSILVHRVWLYASQGTGLRRILSYLSFAITCWAGLFRTKRPDYVFVESPPLFLAGAGVLYAWLRRIPMILNVADLWPDSVVELGVMKDGWPIKVARVFEKWAYRNSDFVCAVTKGIEQSLIEEKHLAPEKILFLPNGVDTDQFRPVSPDLDLKKRLGLMGKHVIVYTGTHGMAHNLQNVLHAAYLLRDDPSIHLLLVGSGSLKPKLMRFARDLELPNVTFLDPVPPEEVPRYLSFALCGLVSVSSIKIFASAVSAKTLVVMACEKPVLFSGPIGGAQFVERTSSGLVANSDDPKALAHAARLLTQNPGIAAQYGKNGRRYVERHLTWGLLVRSWLRQFVEPNVDAHRNPLFT